MFAPLFAPMFALLFAPMIALMNALMNALKNEDTMTANIKISANNTAAKGRIESHHTGFTLIELMCVAAIVAILAAIAFPSYQKYVLKSRRVDAKNALLDLAAREEKHFAINNKYADLTTLRIGTDVQSGGTAYYKLQVTLLPANGFTATATPIATTTQINDDCYTYSIDYLGTQTNLNANGSINTTAGCW